MLTGILSGGLQHLVSRNGNAFLGGGGAFFTMARMQLSALGSVEMQISERKTHAQLHNIQKFTSTLKKMINGQKNMQTINSVRIFQKVGNCYATYLTTVVPSRIWTDAFQEKCLR
jgi:hypothetical protein